MQTNALVIWVLSRNAIVREGLRVFFDRQNWITVAAENLRLLQTKSAELPDAVVVDLAIGAVSGEDFKFVVKGCGDRVVALVPGRGTDLPSIRPLIFRHKLRVVSGAALPKTIIASVKAAASRASSSGSAALPVSRQGVHGAGRAEYFNLNALSVREQEVFDLIKCGYQNRRIARELGVSVKTIETHKENLKRKLNLRSMDELIETASIVRWRKMGKRENQGFPRLTKMA